MVLLVKGGDATTTDAEADVVIWLEFELLGTPEEPYVLVVENEDVEAVELVRELVAITTTYPAAPAIIAIRRTSKMVIALAADFFRIKKEIVKKLYNETLGIYLTSTKYDYYLNRYRAFSLRIRQLVAAA